MPSKDETVGQNVRAFRERMGLSQADLARDMTDAGMEGFYPQTILKVEKGTRSLKLVEGIFMAQLLGVSADELYEPSPGRSSDWRVVRAIRRLNDAWEAAIEDLRILRVSRETLLAELGSTVDRRWVGAAGAALLLSTEEAMRRADDVERGQFSAPGAYFLELARRQKADDQKLLALSRATRKAEDRG